MRIDIVTIFPEVFEPLLASSIVGRARDREIIRIEVHDLRDWSDDPHRVVDDYPYGGGGGMVMKAEPFFRFHDDMVHGYGMNPHVVLMSARGRPFRQGDAFRLAGRDHLCIFCGHYKGVDARVETLCDEEISIGDVVLSGGEIPAMAVVDAVCRLLPGAVNERSSIEGDSFYDGILGPPEYTRPEVVRGLEVPPVLLGGHHARIREWRRNAALTLTKERRPDLLRQREQVVDDHHGVFR